MKHYFSELRAILRVFIIVFGGIGLLLGAIGYLQCQEAACADMSGLLERISVPIISGLISLTGMAFVLAGWSVAAKASNALERLCWLVLSLGFGALVWSGLTAAYLGILSIE